MSENKGAAFKIVIAGAGYWSNKMHLPALQSFVTNKQFEIVGICDLNIESAKNFGEKVNCYNISNNFSELVFKTKPSGAVLLVPPAVIPKLIKECVKFTLPFICEKPPAQDAKEHQDLLDFTKNLSHIVGFNRRFSPMIAQAKTWLAGCRLESIACDFNRVNRINEDFSTTYIHAVDAVLYLTGSLPRNISVEVQYRDGYENIYITGSTINDIVFMIRILPNVASSQERYFLRSFEKSVDICFSQGISIDSPGFAELHINDKIVEHKSPVDFSVLFDDFVGLAGFRSEYLNFYNLLNGQDANISNLANTLHSQKLIEAVRFAVAKKMKHYSFDF